MEVSWRGCGPRGGVYHFYAGIMVVSCDSWLPTDTTGDTEHDTGHHCRHVPPLAGPRPELVDAAPTRGGVYQFQPSAGRNPLCPSASMTPTPSPLAGPQAGRLRRTVRLCQTGGRGRGGSKQLAWPQATCLRLRRFATCLRQLVSVDM